MDTGVRTTNLTGVPISDEVLVNRNGTTTVQAIADLATQLAGTGPLAQAIDAAQEGTITGLTLASLGSGTRVGQKGEVYQGSDKGTWSWNGSAWVRVADLVDTAALQAAVSAVSARVSNVDNTSDADKPISNATQAAILGIAADFPVVWRPGDAPEHFVDSLDGGVPAVLPPLSTGIQRYDDSGRILRVSGSGLIGCRTLYSLEPNKIYLVEFVVQRRTNSPDPSNDAVRCAMAWYDQGANRSAVPLTIIRDLTSLSVGSGRTLVSATISRSAGDGIDLIAPADARYARPYIQTFGVSPVTDIEVIRWEDITHTTTYAPDLDALEARVAAQESIDAGDRLTNVEEQVTAPNSVRYATVAALASANVPVSADYVELLGYYNVGDGGAKYCRRMSAPEAALPLEHPSNGGSVRWAPVGAYSLLQLGAKKDGATDLWSFLSIAAGFGGKWTLPRGDYSLAGVARNLTATDFKLEGEFGSRIVVTTGTAVTVGGTRVAIEGIFFDSNQPSRAGVLFELTGSQCSISRNRWAGKFSIFVRDSGIGNNISYNSFDAFVTTVSPIILKGKNFTCAFNSMDDYFGFGIQAFDGATDGLIAWNTIKARRWDQTVTATAGQTQFTVTWAQADVQRFGMLVNGLRVSFTVNSTDSSPGSRPTVTYTLASALAGGETVSLFAWRSLENINVNFGSSGVKVIGNTLDGTGDGNIVIASGYTTASDADYPHNVQIIGNMCRNAAAGGIGVSKSRGGLIMGNTVVDAGRGLADGATGSQVSEVFMSGIYLPKELGWTVTGNRVVRESGYTYYGIAFSVAGDTSYANTAVGQRRHRVGGNFIENMQRKRYYTFADSSNVLRQIDIDIDDLTWYPYPETLQSLVNTAGWLSRPASTSYWTTATSGSGWTRNTAQASGHPVCIETNDNSYADCTPVGFSLFASGFVRVSFKAYVSAAGQSGYVTIAHSTVPDSDSAPSTTINITNTTPQVYQHVRPIDTIDNFLIRVGGAVSNGKMYVTDIKLEYAPSDVG
ncbi:hypothetical protein HB780_05975 (plasmid) [Rhizobium lusitanum]|uniref:hypothetical protein n=1 Tax=Rhizobium lusitanum TaxID=293958 RepID=UPI00161D806A|nr:hypothetical protein [Rhizobium lusitanum]QND45298.1 hypothetical protein HB780_05975 [Rhizobium lusitanum]